MNRPTFTPGTISHGTLNPAHLLSAYIAALEGFTLINGDYFSRPENFTERDNIAAKIGEAQDCFSEDGTDIDEEKEEPANWLVNEELPDLMNEYAPAGYSFSSHEGDGSDVGFWQNEEEEESEGGDTPRPFPPDWKVLAFTKENTDRAYPYYLKVRLPSGEVCHWAVPAESAQNWRYDYSTATEYGTPPEVARHPQPIHPEA